MGLALKGLIEPSHRVQGRQKRPLHHCTFFWNPYVCVNTTANINRFCLLWISVFVFRHIGVKLGIIGSSSKHWEQMGINQVWCPLCKVQVGQVLRRKTVLCCSLDPQKTSAWTRLSYVTQVKPSQCREPLAFRYFIYNLTTVLFQIMSKLLFLV